jgi:hypothetical protein
MTVITMRIAVKTERPAGASISLEKQLNLNCDSKYSLYEDNMILTSLQSYATMLHKFTRLMFCNCDCMFYMKTKTFF